MARSCPKSERTAGSLATGLKPHTATLSVRGKPFMIDYNRLNTRGR